MIKAVIMIYKWAYICQKINSTALIMKKLSLLFSAFFMLALFSCSDPCDDVDCNGGSCVEGTCICPEGFFGDNCEIECINGVFQNGECVCLAGFEGEACDVEANLCDGVECNGGTCVDGTCDCPDGFFGDNCEIACTNGVFENGACNCSDGYEGDACDTESRVKFFGTWIGTLEDCTIATIIGPYDVPPFPIDMDITANADGVADVDITFGEENGTATVDGDTFTFEDIEQVIDAGGFPITIEFGGVGVLTSDTQLDIDLEITVGADVSNCPLTLTRN
jgi:hypothetical protein